jgi:hypothetical protein
VYDPSSANKIYRTQHICNPQNIDSVKRCLRPKCQIRYSLGLSEQVTKTVKEWTQGRRIPDTSQDNFWRCYTKHYYDKNQYNWLKRAILQKHTALNDKELNKFFYLTYNSTFCHLHIDFVEKEVQRKMKQEFYLLFLNCKPYLPFENLRIAIFNCNLSKYYQSNRNIEVSVSDRKNHC